MSENQSRANERRLPAYTVPLVYYRSWALIGGKVVKIRLCAAFGRVDKNGRVELSRENTVIGKGCCCFVFLSGAQRENLALVHQTSTFI